MTTPITTPAVEPIPLGRGQLGDLVYWHGVNGHRYEGYVSRMYEGHAWSPSICDSWHSDECGCHREPWEYDPEGAY